MRRKAGGSCGRVLAGGLVGLVVLAQLGSAAAAGESDEGLAAAASSTAVDNVAGTWPGESGPATSNVTCNIAPNVGADHPAGPHGPSRVAAAGAAQCVSGDIGAGFGIDFEIALQELVFTSGQPVWEDLEVAPRYEPAVTAGVVVHDAEWVVLLVSSRHYRIRFSVWANGALKQERFVPVRTAATVMAGPDRSGAG